jgi:hypothetical protein
VRTRNTSLPHLPFPGPLIIKPSPHLHSLCRICFARLSTHFKVTKPMTDHKMKQVLTWLNYYIVLYTAVAYLCIREHPRPPVQLGTRSGPSERLTHLGSCCPRLPWLGLPIVYWLFFTDARKLIEEAIKEFKNPQLILSIMFSIISKYLYTTLMGVDFMVREIAEQRRWETYLSTGVMPFGTPLSQQMSDNVREGVRRLMKERTARLDELARMIHNK